MQRCKLNEIYRLVNKYYNNYTVMRDKLQYIIVKD